MVCIDYPAVSIGIYDEPFRTSGGVALLFLRLPTVPASGIWMVTGLYVYMLAADSNAFAVALLLLTLETDFPRLLLTF